MDAVEEIKGRLSIEDVISEYVQLKRAGRNYKGLSPFTNERTPSFVVSPEKQIWHDFSSSRGGDIFTFVQEMEGVDFRGALELLARRAGVDLEQFQRSKPGDSKLKERLYELNELATRFYQAHFKQSQTALEYVLKKRRFSKETALAWRLGYAPNTGSALVDFAKNKGFTQKELNQTGLTNRFGGDLFRGRLLVPLSDPTGRAIGFTGRILDDDDPKAPKYLNTPSTPLYDKSRHVFGLHLAKESIRKSKFVVLAEGNLDVIASHQAGIRQCVATAGTALTAPQLKALGRFTPDIRLSFDADRAGMEATERAIPIASKVGVNLSVITIPSGKDPDELIRQDKKLWEDIINKHQPALDWLIERYQGELDLTSAVGKRQFSDTVLAVVRGLEDSVEQEHYVQRVADIIGVSQDALKTKLASSEPASVRKKRAAAPAKPVDKTTVETLRAQNRLVALLLMQPKLRDLLTDVQPEYLPQEIARQLVKFLTQHPDFDGSSAQLSNLLGRQDLHSDAIQGTDEQRTEPYESYGEGAVQAVTQQRAEISDRVTSSARQQVAEVQMLSNYVKILSLQYEELYQDLDVIELRYEAERLQSYLVEQYVKTQKTNIRSALEQAGADEQTALLNRDKAMNELLRRYKGRT